MTTKRHSIFEPLGKEIAAQMEMVLGSGVADRLPPPEGKILLKAIRWKGFVAILIMYLNYSKANLPTWIIGESLENTLNTPAYI